MYYEKEESDITGAPVILFLVDCDSDIKYLQINDIISSCEAYQAK